MNLQTVIGQIVAWLTARFNALKTAIANESTARIAGDASVTALVTAESAARVAGDTANATAITAEATARVAGDNTLQAAITAETTARVAGDKTNSDALAAETTARTSADTTNSNAITAEIAARNSAVGAVASALVAETTARTSGYTTLNGQIATLSSQTTAALAGKADLTDVIARDAAVLASAIAASKMNIRKAYFANIVDGNTANLLSMIADGTFDAGSYLVKFVGGAEAQMTVTGLKDGTGTAVSQVVSNGDEYYFNVNASGVITDGVFADDKNNIKFNSLDSVISVANSRISAVEVSIAASNATISTLPSSQTIDDKVLAAFQLFLTDLTNSGYVDPN